MAKERSPNYPGLSLESALQAIRRIYERERRTPMATEMAARALGHESLSGPALSKLGALRQFGLLEDVSRGKVRVADEAMGVILRKPEDPEFAAEARGLALKPPLFAELFAAFADASDDALRYHLIRERGFSEEGAAKVIKSFRATVAFANLSKADYTEPNDQDKRRNDVSLGEAFLHADAPGKVRTADRITVDQGRHWAAGGLGGAPLNVYVGPGKLVQVAFPYGEPSPDDLDALIEQVKLTKKLLLRGQPGEQSGNSEAGDA